MSVKGITIGIMLVAGLAYLLYLPFPEESDLPVAMKAIYVITNAVWYFCPIVEAFGGNYWTPFRNAGIPSSILDGVSVREGTFAGMPTIFVEPEGVVAKSTGGAIIYYHGGGWVAGSMGSHGIQVMNMVKKLGMLMVIPMYRLAPEHPFPAAFDDCLHFTKEFMKKSAEFNVDPRKIISMGDSAGGNLALAVALAITDEDLSEKTPDFCMMSLIYPVLQMSNLMLPSYKQNWNPVLLPPAMMARVFLSYAGLHNRTELIEPMLLNLHTEGLGKEILDRTSDAWIPEKYKTKILAATSGSKERRASPELRKRVNKYKAKIQKTATDIRFAPLTADDEKLKKLPHTDIITCEYDILRDDGIILYERMKSLGKPVTHTNFEFASHGLVSQYGVVPYKKLDDEMDKLFKKIQARLTEC